MGRACEALAGATLKASKFFPQNLKNWQLNALFAIAIAACVFFVFGVAIHYGFCLIDDSHSLFGHNLPTWPAIQKILMRGEGKEYIPVTFLSYVLDTAIFGREAYGYHGMNLLYHFIATLSMAALALKIYSRNYLAAFLTAALFAIHPLHVEPVVWISGRKDLLSAGFALGSLLSYWLYLASGARPHRSWHYVLSIALAAAAFLSKGAAIVLPALLLLLDFFFARARNRWLILDKAPFALAAIVSAVRHVQDHRSITLFYGQDYSFSNSISNAFQALIFYTSKAVLPLKLSVYYETGAFTLSALDYFIFSAAVILFAWCYWKIIHARKIFLFGILFFFISISPYLRLIPFGGDFLVADRYFYLASVGIFLIVLVPLGKGRLGLAIAAIFLLAHGALAINRIADWKSDRSLLSSAADRYPRSSYVYLMLGEVDRREGNPDAALLHYQRALELQPARRDELHYLIGQAYIQKQDYEKGIRYFEMALPSATGDVHLDLAAAYWKVGRHLDSSLLYNKLIYLRPWEAMAYFNLAQIYKFYGQRIEAKEALLKVIRIRPNWQAPYLKLAEVFESLHEPGPAGYYREMAQKINEESY